MTESNPIRILCVDDHPLIRKGITTVIRSDPEMQLIGEATTGEEAIEMFRKHRPHVTLMDLRLSGMSGIDSMLAIRAEFPDARIIILTTFEGDAEIRRAFEAGARGYLLKTMVPQEMLLTIRQVHAGKKRVLPEIAAQLAEYYSDDDLTAREIEILQQMASGQKNQDIAERLHISENTVKAHIKHIMEKLVAEDRTQAVAIGVRRGFITLEGARLIVRK